MGARGTAPGLTEAARDAAFREVASGIAGRTAGGYEHGVERAAVSLSVTLDCACVISLVSADGDRLHPIGLHHPAPEAAELLDELAAVSFPADAGYAGQALTETATVLMEHVTVDALHAVRSPFISIAERFGAGTVLAVPLLARSGGLGVVACGQSAEEAFSREDQALVADVAAVLAMAVESALVLEALDGLPGRLRVAVPHEDTSCSPGPAEPSSAASAGLTRREREILAQLARGYTNREIAGRLVLSIRTVEWHRARIQWKLRVSTRAGLITAARTLGLLDA
jgi:DNA-binding CsgD family transcriptional regulator